MPVDIIAYQNAQAAAEEEPQEWDAQVLTGWWARIQSTPILLRAHHHKKPVPGLFNLYGMAHMAPYKKAKPFTESDLDDPENFTNKTSHHKLIKKRLSSSDPEITPRARPVEIAMATIVEKERLKTKVLVEEAKREAQREAEEKQREMEEKTVKLLEEERNRNDSTNQALYELIVFAVPHGRARPALVLASLRPRAPRATPVIPAALTHCCRPPPALPTRALPLLARCLLLEPGHPPASAAAATAPPRTPPSSPASSAATPAARLRPSASACGCCDPVRRSPEPSSTHAPLLTDATARTSARLAFPCALLPTDPATTPTQDAPAILCSPPPRTYPSLLLAVHACGRRSPRPPPAAAPLPLLAAATACYSRPRHAHLLSPPATSGRPSAAPLLLVYCRRAGRRCRPRRGRPLPACA
nr:mucin-7-like [Aegilops tauschii subsp. strangulata]